MSRVCPLAYKKCADILLRALVIWDAFEDGSTERGRGAGLKPKAARGRGLEDATSKMGGAGGPDRGRRSGVPARAQGVAYDVGGAWYTSFYYVPAHYDAGALGNTYVAPYSYYLCLTACRRGFITGSA